MKKRIGRTLLVTALASSMIVTPVFAEPSVDDLKKSKQEVQNEVSSLQTQLTSTLNKIDQLEETLINKGKEIIKANGELEKAQASEKQQYKDMKLRIQYMYEEGGGSYIQKIAESKSLGDMLNQAEYMQEVHSYDRKKLQEYVETKNKIAKLKTSLEKDMKKMESAQKEYETEQTALTQTINDKKDEVADFDQQLQAAAAKAAEEAARREEASRRAAAQRSQSSNSGSTGSHSSGGSGGGSKKPSGSNSGSNQNIKPPSGVSGQAVVNYAMQFIGNPYVWGGTSLTNGADCSGFTMQVYAKFGISLPHSSSGQRSYGRGVSYSEAKPGDLICYDGHVGIYIGGGKIVNASNSAPYPKGGIKTQSATYRTILSVRRLL